MVRWTIGGVCPLGVLDGRGRGGTGSSREKHLPSLPARESAALQVRCVAARCGRVYLGWCWRGRAGMVLGGMVGEGGANLVDVGAVGADGFVEGLAGDVELFGPVGDVGGDFGVDLLGVAGALGVVFVDGVELVGFGGGFLRIVVLGHAGVPLFLFGWCWLGG